MGNFTDLATSQVDRHSVIDPAILYFGTPVALLATVDEAGHPNLAPKSSVWWLGRTAGVGIAARSRTGRNLVTTRECMLSFQRYFGLGEEARTSLLSTIDERIAP